jgi:hypothetical protein
MLLVMALETSGQPLQDELRSEEQLDAHMHSSHLGAFIPFEQSAIRGLDL